MATQVLKDSKAKITRAQEQLNGLESKFKRFSDSKPYTLRQEKDPDNGDVTLVYYPNAPIPDNWAIILGEIFFNLRSALDMAVHELTIREQGSVLDKTEFPIFDDPNRFGATKRNGDPAPGSGLYKIRGLRQQTQILIETLQPFHETDPDKVAIVGLLHEMNIRDKHKELFLCRQMFHTAKLTLTETVENFVSWSGPPLGGTLDEQTVIGRLETSQPLDDSKVYMDAELTLEIMFDQSCSVAFKRNEDVIKMTTIIINGVGKIISLLENSLT